MWQESITLMLYLITGLLLYIIIASHVTLYRIYKGYKFDKGIISFVIMNTILTVVILMTIRYIYKRIKEKNSE